MLAAQYERRGPDNWTRTDGCSNGLSPQLVIYFGDRIVMAENDCHAELKAMYPEAHLLGCSTGGEILADEVLDGSIVATAIEFENTDIQLVSANLRDYAGIFECGRDLGQQLMADNLGSVFVLSDGTDVNGSDLVRGITEIIGRDIPLTGGLAGDGDRFGETLVGIDDRPSSGIIGALGFYGDSFVMGHGSVGGWDEFGPNRAITKSSGNVLYELDGEPALELYKRYLGPEANELPGSALLYPLRVWPPENPDSDVVRTIVGIDEDAQSLIFAGNVPEGYLAQLMQGNFGRLIDGAASAAGSAKQAVNGNNGVAILVSCIGRKLLLGQRAGEEAEAIKDILGDNIAQLGFYSYGEISPHAKSGMCELHNQTMTVTVISEN